MERLPVQFMKTSEPVPKAVLLYLLNCVLSVNFRFSNVTVMPSDT